MAGPQGARCRPRSPNQRSRQCSACFLDEFPRGKVNEGLAWLSLPSWQEAIALGTSAHHYLGLIGHSNEVEAGDKASGAAPGT